MTLPMAGTIPVVAPGADYHPRPAFLVRFPEDLWGSLQSAAAGGDVTGLRLVVSDDGTMTLSLPDGDSVPLDARSTGTASEINAYSSTSNTLTPMALASTRLSVPISSASTARAADKMKAQNDAMEKERKERSVRVEGSAPPATSSQAQSRGRPSTLSKLAPGTSGTAMGRTVSTPPVIPVPTSGPSGNGATSSTAQQPMIPLKTRVMQLLALGPTTVADIIRRVGGDEQNVMRVVNVVGRPSRSNPPTFTLLPNQYSKIKIGPGQWKYTYAEQQEVIRLARDAFDELGLPPDAEERSELDRKEQEALTGYQSATSSSTGSLDRAGPVTAAGPASTPVSAVPPVAASGTPAAGSGVSKRTESPAPGRSKASNGKAKATGPQSKIAREKAKFMAERGRSTSLPNVKAEDTAAPSPGPREAQLAEITGRSAKDGKLHVDRHDKNKVQKGRSRDYSSESDTSEVDAPLRGRSVAKKSSPPEHVDHKPPISKREKLSDRVKQKEKEKRDKERLSVNGHSQSPEKTKRRLDVPDPGQISEDEAEEGEIRGRPKIKSHRGSSPGLEPEREHKRKTPPPELRLNGNGTSSGLANARSTQPKSAPLPRSFSSTSMRDHSRPVASSVSADAESLRDRYEELFPAYQQLGKKLAKLYQAAEESDLGYGTDRIEMGQDQVEKMVKKYEKWHHELAEIRRWFGGGS